MISHVPLRARKWSTTIKGNEIDIDESRSDDFDYDITNNNNNNDTNNHLNIIGNNDRIPKLNNQNTIERYEWLKKVATDDDDDDDEDEDENEINNNNNNNTNNNNNINTNSDIGIGRSKLKNKNYDPLTESNLKFHDNKIKNDQFKQFRIITKPNKNSNNNDNIKNKHNNSNNNNNNNGNKQQSNISNNNNDNNNKSRNSNNNNIMSPTLPHLKQFPHSKNSLLGSKLDSRNNKMLMNKFQRNKYQKSGIKPVSVYIFEPNLKRGIYHHVGIKSYMTVDDVISNIITTYREERKTPQLVGYSNKSYELRHYDEDDSEPDMEFPPLDRNRKFIELGLDIVAMRWINLSEFNGNLQDVPSNYFLNNISSLPEIRWKYKEYEVIDEYDPKKSICLLSIDVDRFSLCLKIKNKRKAFYYHKRKTSTSRDDSEISYKSVPSTPTSFSAHTGSAPQTPKGHYTSPKKTGKVFDFTDKKPPSKRVSISSNISNLSYNDGRMEPHFSYIFKMLNIANDKSKIKIDIKKQRIDKLSQYRWLDGRIIKKHNMYILNEYQRKADQKRLSERKENKSNDDNKNNSSNNDTKTNNNGTKHKKRRSSFYLFNLFGSNNTRDVDSSTDPTDNNNNNKNNSNNTTGGRRRKSSSFSAFSEDVGDLEFRPITIDQFDKISVSKRDNTIFEVHFILRNLPKGTEFHSTPSIKSRKSKDKDIIIHKAPLTPLHSRGVDDDSENSSFEDVNPSNGFNAKVHQNVKAKHRKRRDSTEIKPTNVTLTKRNNNEQQGYVYDGSILPAPNEMDNEMKYNNKTINNNKTIKPKSNNIKIKKRLKYEYRFSPSGSRNDSRNDSSMLPELGSKSSTRSLSSEHNNQHSGSLHKGIGYVPHEISDLEIWSESSSIHSMEFSYKGDFIKNGYTFEPDKLDQLHEHKQLEQPKYFEDNFYQTENDLTNSNGNNFVNRLRNELSNMDKQQQNNNNNNRYNNNNKIININKPTSITVNSAMKKNAKNYKKRKKYENMNRFHAGFHQGYETHTLRYKAKSDEECCEIVRKLNVLMVHEKTALDNFNYYYKNLNK